MANADGTYPGNGAGSAAANGRVDEARVAWARKQAGEEKDFRSHLVSYVVVIGFLFILDLLTGPGLWFFWPALGWGVGIVFHAMQVYTVRGGPDSVERRTQDLLRRSSTAPSPAPLQRPAMSVEVARLN